MIYIITLLYSIIHFYTIKKYKIQKQNKFIIYSVYFSPTWILWLLICGGQYYVGTDYESYYNIFKNADTTLFYAKKEYLFAYIVDIWHRWNLNPQGLFYIFYSIGITFFLLICTKLNHKYLFLFFFVYFTVSNLFFNQLNGLRQSIAIYIITYSVLLLFEKHGLIKFIIGIIFASQFHQSSLFAFIFLLFKFYQPSRIILFLLLTIAVLFSLFGSYNFLFSSLKGMIPSIYLHYLEGEFNISIGIKGILPKLVYIPIYIMSFSYLKDINKDKNILLYKVGIFAYSIRMLCINNIALDRLGYLFVLLSILPLYLYFQELYKKKEYKLLLLLLLFCLSIFFLKTILFPSKEYLYKSIYFN